MKTEDISTYGFLGKPDCNYYYFPIVKNAHRWGSTFFENFLSFTQVKGCDIDFTNTNKKIIVFLRDPIKRWYSGATTWYVGLFRDKDFTPDDFVINDLALQVTFSAVRIDPHTHLQSEYLKGMDTNKCICFDCDDTNFEYNLKHFIKHKIGVNLDDCQWPKINVIDEKYFHKKVRQQLRDACESNFVFKKNLYDFHKNDISFINHMKENFLYEAK